MCYTLYYIKNMVIWNVFGLAIFLDFRKVCDNVHCTGNKGVEASVELTSAVIGENGVLRGR